MTSQNGRAFNEWLRGQLKAKKMSQRQLAQQSGVDHSTISRLIRGDRMPSLGTATKLARGLRELRDDADTPAYLGLVSSGTTNPTARVEYALRADDLLSEPQVRQIMEYYLAVRMRRYGRASQGESGATATGQTVRAHARPRPPADLDRHNLRYIRPSGAGVLATLRRRGGNADDRLRDLDDRHRPTGRPLGLARAGPLLEHTPGHGPVALHDRVSGTANAGAGAPAFAITGRSRAGFGEVDRDPAAR